MMVYKTDSPFSPSFKNCSSTRIGEKQNKKNSGSYVLEILFQACFTHWLWKYCILSVFIPALLSKKEQSGQLV